ncbi:DUF485 domain-containing protein [Mycoplasmatota bacterium]|nr:DUF485 domain-containing protein [Mycoplasmatota bacterium]
MGHGPATKWEEDKSSDYKARLGIWMFFGYIIIYGGFMLINVINPKLMGLDIGSLNLAVVYGFGLIVFALILAIIYNNLCSRAEKKLNETKESDE